jgi:hypothetical protein
MALGEADAMVRRDEVVAFFGWQRAKAVPPATSSAAEML